MTMNIDKIIENSKNIGKVDIVENDVAKEIVEAATLAYTKFVEKFPQSNQVPFWRGIDMMEQLKHLGKTNVRNHLEKLGEKGILESKTHDNKKVYRIKVVEEE